MQKKRKKNVGIFIFDLVEVLDFSGPYEVFSSARLTKQSTSSIQNKPQAFNVFTFSYIHSNHYHFFRIYIQVTRISLTHTAKKLLENQHRYTGQLQR